jgi:hypothetical protein
MNTFERDFTQELEKCVQKGTADIPVPKGWGPSRVAPPEIHTAAGAAAEVPVESMNYLLRRNSTFQQIYNLLQMNLNETILNTLTKVNKLNEEKVQVWMFARMWFNMYAEYLLEPLTQRSAFYKERHDEFLSLMRHMLEFNPSRRLSFRAALASWFPDSDLFTKEAQSEDDDESDAEPPPSAPSVASAAPPAPQPAAVTPQPAVPPAAAPTTAARRLVLKGLGGSAERSKTRKISRS